MQELLQAPERMCLLLPEINVVVEEWLLYIFALFYQLAGCDTSISARADLTSSTRTNSPTKLVKDVVMCEAWGADRENTGDIIWATPGNDKSNYFQLYVKVSHHAT